RSALTIGARSAQRTDLHRDRPGAADERSSDCQIRRVGRNVQKLIHAFTGGQRLSDAAIRERIFLSLEENREVVVGSDMSRRIIHFGEHPLPGALAALIIGKTSRTIRVSRI